MSAEPASPAPAAGSEGVAIVGIGLRVPGASDLEGFWHNLHDGIESIRFFCREELEASRVSRRFLDDPSYVMAKPALDEVDRFDPAFFGMSAREAAFLDPQARLFLECAAEAFQDGGHDPRRFDGAVGVFASAKYSQYFVQHLWPRLQNAAEGFEALVANDKDYLAAQTSYRFDLRGPSLGVQTACSSSLVAASLAAQSLLAHECDMALAGGVAIGLPAHAGYFYVEGGPFSRDGHCRPFDARATGTVFGDGAGVVLMRRLDDALAAGDSIYAVVLGSAVTNDGALRIGFTAPGVECQAEAIALAHAVAGVDPASIGYVEAHGSGTPLGDSIEFEALDQAFGRLRPDRPFCGLGSVKSNVGHLENAAGVTGLIKAALALQRGVIPPSLHFEAPNPEVRIDGTPFFVPRAAIEWSDGESPRRAGVSSFGIGGTNAHVVLEAPPQPRPSQPSRGPQVIALSGGSPEGLDRAAARIADGLEREPDAELADVAYTLQLGRPQREHRRVWVCRSLEEAVTALRGGREIRSWSGHVTSAGRPVAFLFPGVGDHYPGMAAELYRSQPTFRSWVDRGCERLEPPLGLDLREHLFPEAARDAAEPGALEPGAAKLDLRAMLSRAGRASAGRRNPLYRTRLAQPAVFVVEHALARLWMEWGVEPDALLGYSVGEYVAACLAGVFSFEDGLELIAERARLIEALPPSAMTAIAAPRESVEELLGDGTWLATVNAPSQCTAGGREDAIAALEARLRESGLSCQRLRTGHAFHTPLMSDVGDRLAARLARTALEPPRIPIVSNLTADWLTDDESRSPAYWAEHLQRTLEFSAGIEKLCGEVDRVALEVGAGNALTSMALQHRVPRAGGIVALASLPSAYDRGSDQAHLLETAAKLWLHGVPLDWQATHRSARRRRLHLAPSPFDRQRYWIDAPEGASGERLPAELASKNQAIEEWFYAPVWHRLVPATGTRRGPPPGGSWLVFAEDDPLGDAVVAELRRWGARAVSVVPGRGFDRRGEERFAIDPSRPEHYRRVLAALDAGGCAPERVLHLWSMCGDGDVALDDLDAAERDLERGFYSLLHLGRALLETRPTSGIEICAASNDLCEVVGGEPRRPARAGLLGPLLALPREADWARSRFVDVGSGPAHETARRLIEELGADAPAFAVAFRGRYRWARAIEPVSMPEPASWDELIDPDAAYLVTGGLGEIGLELARELGRRVPCGLALMSRRELPGRAAWEDWLAEHPDDDPVSDTIRRLQDAERAGARVRVVPGDVTDPDQVAAAVQQVETELGPIRGVLHAAGVMGSGLIELKTRDAAERVIAPKVRGAMHLQRALRHRDLDFFVCFSSTVALSPPLGEVDHCAGSSVLDAIAECGAAAGRKVLSVNWGPWESRFWSADLESVPAHLRERAVANQRLGGIDGAGGVESLGRALRSGAGRLVISSRQVDSEGRGALMECGTAAPEGIGAAPSDSARRSRPGVAADYVPPADAVDEQLCGIWEELLGIEPVGIRDHFFELGGNSLIATHLAWRIRSAFGCAIPLQEILENPTVEAVSSLVRNGGSDRTPAEIPTTLDPDALSDEELLSRIRELPEAEVDRMLDELDGPELRG